MSKQQQRNRKQGPKSSLSQAQKAEVSILAKRQLIKASELKYLSMGNAYAPTGTNQFVSLTDVPQGTTDSARIGDSLTPVSLHIKYQWESSIARAVPSEYLRIYVFQWFPNSVNLAPSGALMFQNDPYAGVVNFRSNLSIDYTAKHAAQFRVIYDKTHCMCGYGTSTVWNTSMAGIISVNISLASVRKTIQYTAASTTDAAGKLYFGYIGSTGTNQCTLTLNSEFHFRDS